MVCLNVHRSKDEGRHGESDILNMKPQHGARGNSVLPGAGACASKLCWGSTLPLVAVVLRNSLRVTIAVRMGTRVLVARWTP